MKIIEIEQGTETWRSWRKKGITATDIVAIMDECPFKTEKQIYEAKLGFEEPLFQNDAMRLGKELEPVIREKLKEIGFNTKPLCVEDENAPLFKASLDAYDEEQKVLFEIKVSDRTFASLESKVIPRNYLLQCQWQQMIVKPKAMFIVAYSPTKSKIMMLPVLPDPLLWQEMQDIALLFWNKVQNDEDFCIMDDAEWKELVKKWLEVERQIEELKKKEEEYREALIAKANNRNATGCGIKVTRSTRKGTINYNAIPELIGVELEAYRKDPISSWRITKCQR